MAAPAHTAITAPTGIKLPNGFKGILIFARLPTACFWVKGMKSGAIDGGEAILQSTMHNTLYHTKAPRALRMEGDTVLTCAYDAHFREQIRNTLVNQPGSITEYFPDNSYEDYYGYLQNAEFSEFKDGEFPEVTITVVKTNYDPVNRVEVGPVFTSVTGT